MPDLPTAVLLAAVVCMGLSAGLFYAYSCSVMPGLRRADDRTFVTTMQEINVAILNGWFMLSFLGGPLLAGVATAVHFGTGGKVLAWTIAGLVLAIAKLVITGAVNVPLNNVLAAASREGDVGAVRARFEARWVRFNNLRTLAALGSFACLAWALAIR
ncbi:DUF1772 domain-containing protein [Longispora albida]|uniref:anthrone oxygenase family protein n=1 Tax=Longispora albida TaxID=203523 RepID=UPI00037FCC05|nr:anthrone oxygenase family protein [Longispora albida]